MGHRKDIKQYDDISSAIQVLFIVNSKKDQVEAHLFQLFNWMVEVAPETRFEIRLMKFVGAERKPQSGRRQFRVTDIGSATDYVCKMNALGYNCYVIPNCIREKAPDHYATDYDICATIHHFIDADGIDPAQLNRYPQFPFAFIVITGLTPQLRCHAYWRLAELRTDMEDGWRATQHGLAHAFQTDPSVCNPSRMARLAGTVSYPREDKQARGYITELTEIIIPSDQQPVDNEAFIEAFPNPKPPIPDPPPPSGTDEGDVPLEVIECALDAITPCGQGEMKKWLSVCHAVLSANRGARHLWEAWQRQGHFRRGDERLWDNLSRTQQSPMSYLLLFKLAKEGDEIWYRDDGPAQEWWYARAEKYYASEETNPIIHKRTKEVNMGQVHELFPNNKAPMNERERAAISQKLANDAELKRREEAAERSRQRRLHALRHAPKKPWD